MSLWYMFESHGIGDGLTCPQLLILMMKRKGITKGNVINYLCVLCWERVEVLLNHCWCNFMFVYLWTVQCYENGHLLIICVNLSSELFWGIGCDKCYVHWERKSTLEDIPFRGTYRAPRWILYFEGCIARRDGYYYWGTYHTQRWMHRLICPHGSHTKR